MIDALVAHVAQALPTALFAILVPLPCFILLGVLAKGGKLIADVRRAADESRINLLIHFFDALVFAPFLVIAAVFLHGQFRKANISLVPIDTWTGLHPTIVVIIALILIDFIGYWRHRLEHSALLWPSHAIHHSDTEMTWLAIFRFHPFNRFTTLVIDQAFLLTLGMPTYALIAATAVKHYYGAFIHADLPWTYGRAGKVFVSPAMHRWHHSIDPSAYGTNYATVFSIFDRLFGTYRVPGPHVGALGVPEPMLPGVVGQLVHPLRPSSYRHISSRLKGRKKAATTGTG